jgi:outer membrane PBP1 activator LpoA protein
VTGEIAGLSLGRAENRKHHTSMKIHLIVPGITLCAALAAVGGCGKQESPPAAETQKATEGASPEATKTVDTATTAAKQVPDQATVQVNAGEQQAQGLIDRAKAYIAEKKYQDALGSLNQLANTKLTADQQKLVDDLKAQIQSALAKATASDPASALGGALGGQK